VILTTSPSYDVALPGPADLTVWSWLALTLFVLAFVALGLHLFTNAKLFRDKGPGIWGVAFMASIVIGFIGYQSSSLTQPSYTPYGDIAEWAGETYGFDVDAEWAKSLMRGRDVVATTGGERVKVEAARLGDGTITLLDGNGKPIPTLADRSVLTVEPGDASS